MINLYDKLYRMIVDVKFWFLHRFVKKHQYNTIYTDLEPGYYDEDTRILHGVFQCVVEYYRGEWEMVYGTGILKEIKETKDVAIIRQLQQQYDRGQHIQDLYLWWVYDYPQLVNDGKMSDSELTKLENEKLTEVINLREHLWS